MLRLTAVAAVAGLLLTGCATDELAGMYGSGGANYQSADGAILEIPAENREEAPVFEGVTENGVEVASEEYRDQVVVVNFWYAACGPCRAEAPDLVALHDKYGEQDVAFLGVNTRDQPDTALAFARKYGIAYPSVMDADSGAVRLAFSGAAAPSAVPTTLVLDKEGRVAARFLGQIMAPSALDAVIRDLLAEDA